MEFDPGMFGPPMKKEGTAEMREAMLGVFAFFSGLLEAGFTEAQALTILGNMMRPHPNG